MSAGFSQIHNKASGLLILPVSVIVLLCALPVMGVITPRIMGFLPGIVGIVSVLAYRLVDGQWPELNKNYLYIALATSFLAGFSSLWALDSAMALERGGKILFLLGSGALLFSVLSQPQQVFKNEWLGRFFPLAFLAAGAVCLFELYGRGIIYYILRDEQEMRHDLSMLNRSVVFFALLLLPALNILKNSNFETRIKTTIQWLLIFMTAAMLVRTDSQSAQIALLVGAVFWWGFPHGRAVSYKILSALIAFGVVIMPWAVQFFYHQLAAKVHTLPWLSNAYAADRLEIWDFVARKALESPLYGFGIEATRHIEKFETAKMYTPHDHVLHPHNAVLQIWIEFGALGIVFLCAFTAFILQRISKLEREEARLCLSMFMAVFAVSCTSYGLWQGWWLGLFTLIAALCGYCVHTTKSAQ